MESSLNRQYPYLGLTGKLNEVSTRLVNCRGCTKCCEKGIAYVLPQEVPSLEALAVPLVEIDGVHFIKRRDDGSCSMLDKEAKRCTIYENRPMCCRAFPLDVFSRNGSLEWGVYTYCPPDRVLPIVERNGKAELDLEVVGYLASSLEKHLNPSVLEFLDVEDKVAAQIEILDEHAEDFETLGPVLRG
ncbi:MAG: YkgJ family cysteine cluster protein [Bacteroidota bacterium]